jgi:hypothetical protein
MGVATLIGTAVLVTNLKEESKFSFLLTLISLKIFISVFWAFKNVVQKRNTAK